MQSASVKVGIKMPEKRSLYLTFYMIAWTVALVGILLIIGIDAVRLATVVIVTVIKAYLLYRIEYESHERTKERILQEVKEQDSPVSAS